MFNGTQLLPVGQIINTTVADGLGYCYDLNDMVEYYNLYDLMKHWQSDYGDRIYNLNYENHN